MSTTDEMDTQRTRVLDALEALFPQRDAADAADLEVDYGISFSVVSRDPLGQLPKGKLSAIGIYGSDTARSRNSSWTSVTMPCVAELHLAREEGVPLAKSMERYLGAVEKRLRDNKTLGGLIADLEVTSDSVDVDSPYGPQVDGALYFTVKFFQNTEDPRKGRA